MVFEVNDESLPYKQNVITQSKQVPAMENNVSLASDTATPKFATLIVLIIFVIAIKYRRWLRIFVLTAPRDLIGVILMIRVKLTITRARRSNATVHALFARQVNRHPDRILFYYRDRRWTFEDIHLYSRRMANVLVEHGLKQGDEVALFAESRPEYVAAWLACSQAGIVVGLVNSSLRQDSLVNSLTVIKARAIIFGRELDSAVNAVRSKLDENMLFFALGDECASGDRASSSSSNVVDLEPLITVASSKPVNVKVNFADRLMYIFTSGTTGLPKASIITHHKYILRGSMNFFPGIAGQEHTVYCPLPLYHSLAGNGAVGMCLLYGHTMVIKAKFSASEFWSDIVRHNCTMFLYVGELVRYLLAAPKCDLERAHSLQLMVGVGLRPNLWKICRTRFGVTKIMESYGSTEANCSLINLTSHEGACGFLPKSLPDSVMRRSYPTFIIEVDHESGEPIRDLQTGLCKICPPGVAGCFVGRIINNDLMLSFEGYVDRAATDNRIVRNVLSNGDAFYLTGDLVVCDELGYVYFHDRIGDTYRWRSENVSTMEIESIMSKMLDLRDVVVYGVTVPGHEGRAGMAAIHDPERLITKMFLNDQLIDGFANNLPLFAWPVFVRIVDNVRLTESLKFVKCDLKSSGYDLTRVNDDPIYVLMNGSKSHNSAHYVRLDVELHQKIMSGRVRL